MNFQPFIFSIRSSQRSADIKFNDEFEGMESTVIFKDQNFISPLQLNTFAHDTKTKTFRAPN
jgi:hypothetical protein